ncbi:MAG: hypothetical protein AAGD11_20670 [Planctomycetota bacterium]
MKRRNEIGVLPLVPFPQQVWVFDNDRTPLFYGACEARVKPRWPVGGLLRRSAQKTTPMVSPH